jgi:acylphosphatase
VKQSYLVQGKVQGVMFRKTLILAANKRALRAGATNDALDHDTVHFSLEGDSRKIKELEVQLLSLDPLNSWGARAMSLIPLSLFKEIETHEVTTENIENLKFSSGVEFYL